MIFNFNAKIYEENKRYFISIPFNVWDMTNLKGNIPCVIKVNNISYECKLLPKGKGNYLIPVVKKLMNDLEIDKEYAITLETIESLTRINHDSPYSKENPIRHIDNINEIMIHDDMCGQCCVAMLTGLSVDEVVKVMGKKHVSWSKILETLDYYGISYGKAIYPKKEYSLPKCCILNNDNRFIIWYKDRYYGVKDVDDQRIVNYIEIYVV